jgi:6-phosphogluconolactonase
MIVVLFGVAASGKSTVGAMLASAMNCAFLEGDALHPSANIDKMSRGIPLTDEDRRPWLAAIHARIVDFVHRGEDLVVACSALKQTYRQSLADGVPITWVFLKASEDLIRFRLENRAAHFMKADMLASQFDALEEPSEDAIVVDASLQLDIILAQILTRLTDAIDLRIAPDLHDLSSLVGAAMVRVIETAVSDTGQCSLALSGGGTPRELYGLLASRFRDQIPWQQVHVFWGDERYVPADHPDSNYRLARETLLDHVPWPDANIHPMPTHFPSPEMAAQDYERTLREYFGADGPRFDLNLLGVGSDGHTASLFAGSPALNERTRWVMSVRSGTTPESRLTLTLPALTQSANIFVLVAGSNKASALKHALSNASNSDTYPAAGLRQSPGRVIWWVDQDAATQLASRRFEDPSSSEEDGR